MKKENGNLYQSRIDIWNQTTFIGYLIGYLIGYIIGYIINKETRLKFRLGCTVLP